jgi:hypothetical protein
VGSIISVIAGVAVGGADVGFKADAVWVCAMEICAGLDVAVGFTFGSVGIGATEAGRSQADKPKTRIVRLIIQSSGRILMACFLIVLPLPVWDKNLTVL